MALEVKIKENEEKFIIYVARTWQQVTQGEHMEKAMTATHLAYTARCTFIRSEVDVRRLAGLGSLVTGQRVNLLVVTSTFFFFYKSLNDSGLLCQNVDFWFLIAKMIVRFYCLLNSQPYALLDKFFFVSFCQPAAFHMASQFGTFPQTRTPAKILTLLVLVYCNQSQALLQSCPFHLPSFP